MKVRNIIIISLIVLIFGIYMFGNKEVEHKKDQSHKEKIGIIISSISGKTKMDGMIDGLEQYGYSKDDLDIIIKNSYGDKEKIKELSKELVEEDVDIIVVTGAFETAAIKEVTDNIPTVFIGVGCSVELGYVQDNISTGCNITGIDSHYVQLSGKRLEFLKRILPDTKNVLILYNPTITPLGPSSEILYEAAKTLEIELTIVPVEGRDDMVYELLKNKDDVDGAMLMCSLLLESTIDSIVEVSLENKIPIMGLNDHQVERGVLGFYGSTNYNEGIQSARIVANILKGQDPRIIPIEAPEKLEFHLNLNTAEILGIEIETLDIKFVDKIIKQ